MSLRLTISWRVTLLLLTEQPTWCGSSRAQRWSSPQPGMHQKEAETCPKAQHMLVDQDQFSLASCIGEGLISHGKEHIVEQRHGRKWAYSRGGLCCSALNCGTDGIHAESRFLGSSLLVPEWQPLCSPSALSEFQMRVFGVTVKTAMFAVIVTITEISRFHHVLHI